MADEMGHSFLSIARSQEYLQQLLTGDPFARETLPPGSKRVVTFLREAPARPATLPRSDADAWVIAVRGREVFTAYVPSDRGPAFMTLIEKAFGKEVTTRTWETVLKCAAA
jgi:uncharacterized protein (DUF1697 family)